MQCGTKTNHLFHNLNYSHTLWNEESVVSNTLKNQKLNLILNQIIIAMTLIDKTHHK